MSKLWYPGRRRFNSGPWPLSLADLNLGSTSSHMGVSINGGTPKWLILYGKIPFKWMIWGYLYDLGNPHICLPPIELIEFFSSFFFVSRSIVSHSISRNNGNHGQCHRHLLRQYRWASGRQLVREKPHSAHIGTPTARKLQTATLYRTLLGLKNICSCVH